MMSKRQVISSERDCAAMLGINLHDYQEKTKKILVKKQKNNPKKYDDSILSKLGLTQYDLKKKRAI